jgi:hypothetical protein
MEEFDVGPAPVEQDRLAVLHNSLEEALGLQAAIAQMEADLKAFTDQYNYICQSRIPDLMTSMSMPEVTFKGWKVQVKEFISGNLPKKEEDPEGHARGIDWIVNAGGGGIIKTEVAVQFGRSQHNEALDLAAKLNEQGFPAVCDSGVHVQTLWAFARERLKNGDDLDLDVLGLFVGKVAKFAAVDEKGKRIRKSQKNAD